METQDESRRRAGRRRPRLGFSGRAIRWVYLATLSVATIVLAAVAGLLPPSVLADRPALSIANVSAVSVAAALVAVLLAPLGGLGRVARRWPPLIALLLVNATLFVLFPPGWLLGRLQSNEVLFRVDGAGDAFALTIDDGLDPATTPALLDVLEANEARATFFVLGETLDANQPLARRLLADGHELANHQWTDEPAVALPPHRLRSQIERADAELRELTTPRWFRPGGGAPTETALETAARLGYRTALGTVFPFDSHLPSDRFITAYVAGRTRAGAVVILHDGGDRGLRTAAALAEALPKLRERGLRAVTLTELAR